MTSNKNENSNVRNTLTNQKQLVDELTQRAAAVKEQVKQLEEAKVINQETMKLEVSI